MVYHTSHHQSFPKSSQGSALHAVLLKCFHERPCSPLELIKSSAITSRTQVHIAIHLVRYLFLFPLLCLLFSNRLEAWHLFMPLACAQVRGICLISHERGPQNRDGCWRQRGNSVIAHAAGIPPRVMNDLPSLPFSSATARASRINLSFSHTGKRVAGSHRGL